MKIVNCRLPLLLLATLCFLSGCQSDENDPKDINNPPGLVSQPSEKKQKSKKKKFRDPINDMFQIKREQSKPFVTSDSDILNSQEREIFRQSWENQHDEAEDIHSKSVNKHDADRKKRHDWVW